MKFGPTDFARLLQDFTGRGQIDLEWPLQPVAYVTCMLSICSGYRPLFFGHSPMIASQVRHASVISALPFYPLLQHLTAGLDDGLLGCTQSCEQSVRVFNLVNEVVFGE